jgi:Na+-translocating ferredoxin:NAD+ oxidoreductase subunit C
MHFFKRLKTFKGGIHPPENKKLTENLPITDFLLPDTVYLPLNQHLGSPATPLVQAGDVVIEGQKIAAASGFISANIHSPISGTVRKIAPVPYVLGKNMTGIIIDRDKNIPLKTWTPQKINLAEITKDKFIETIKEKGIVGLGGAVFPTHVKFMTKPTQKLHTIIINACECEPYLTVDNRALLEMTELFLTGLNIIKKATKVDRIIIGVEDNKPQAIQLLIQKTKLLLGVKVVELQTKYPQGGEKMLIKAVTNKEVPTGGLPIDVGIVVLNVNTVIAIAEAFIYDKPLIEKVVTVSGKGIAQPKNIRVKIGTEFQTILDFCGGITDHTRRVVVGGPMMGFAQADATAAVLKSTSGLLALTASEIASTDLSPCIKCGKCVAACPVNLLPLKIAKFIEHNRLDLALKAGLKECIECGSCVFGCPSRRPILQLIKYGKIKNQKKEALKKES